METQDSQAEVAHSEAMAKYQINPKRAMFTIILSIFVDSLGYIMVLPLLPAIVIDGFGASPIVYGVLIASNAVAILIFGPVWGKLSDKFGRKKILIISQAGTGLAFLLMVFSNSLFIIFCARILDGVFSGQFPIVRAYISDVTTPQTRASHMGKIMAGYTSSMIIGPFIGGVLGEFNWRFPMIFASLLTIISIILTKLLLVESMPEERIRDLNIKLQENELSSEVKDRILNKEVGLRFVEVFILSLISMIFSTSFSLVLNIRYHANPFIIGTMMVVPASFIMIYGLVFMKRLIQRIGEKRMFFLGIIIFIIIFFVYPYLNELWMIYILMLPYAFSAASIGPLISTNITKAIGPDKQGALSGWTTNISAISQIISPIIAASFLEIGGVAIGFIFINSYQLIGLINVLLGSILILIVFLDIRHYPYLYSYERIRKKRRAIQKRKKKAGKQKKKDAKKNPEPDDNL
ncbi:MAG: MFS transporter [Promethearchaeota archaeon]|jgi:DHA1 family tetracycline resistance protein-like MFS transporter